MVFVCWPCQSAGRTKQETPFTASDNESRPSYPYTRALHWIMNTSTALFFFGNDDQRRRGGDTSRLVERFDDMLANDLLCHSMAMAMTTG